MQFWAQSWHIHCAFCKKYAHKVQMSVYVSFEKYQVDAQIEWKTYTNCQTGSKIECYLYCASAFHSTVWFPMINQMIIVSLDVSFHKYCGSDGEFLIQAQLCLLLLQIPKGYLAGSPCQFSLQSWNAWWFLQLFPRMTKIS